MSNKTTDILKLQTKFGGEEYIYKGNRTGLREFDPNFEVCRCKKCNNKKLIKVFNKFSGDITHWCPICKVEEFIEHISIEVITDEEAENVSPYIFCWTQNGESNELQIKIEQESNNFKRIKDALKKVVNNRTRK